MLATEPRIVATATDYAELHQALRARAGELQGTRLSLDHITGLPSGYSAKLLSHSPRRSIGPISLGPLLQVLGLRIQLVEDRAAAVQFSSRLEIRRSHADAEMRTPKKPQNQQWAGDSAWGKKLRAIGILATSPKRRSAIGRVAARARWARRGLVEG